MSGIGSKLKRRVLLSVDGVGYLSRRDETKREGELSGACGDPNEVGYRALSSSL